jgi:hypothetical protein
MYSVKEKRYVPEQEDDVPGKFIRLLLPEELVLLA